MTDYDKLVAEIEGLRATVELWERAWQRVVEERDTLRAENERLREDRDVYAETTVRWWYQARQNNLDAWRANKRLAAMMRKHDRL